MYVAQVTLRRDILGLPRVPSPPHAATPQNLPETQPCPALPHLNRIMGIILR